ncbi:MAG: class I SAM-dependent methyltransferase [Betaproteobacteria bacterium]|nr:class I SAM-dependent methyltransferase [Betaproteobacteria bacterium]
MGEKRRRTAAAPGDAARRRALEHAAHARRLVAQSAFAPALGDLVQALALAPEVDALWSQFGEVIRFFNFREPLDRRLRTLLGRALEHPAVDPGDLVRPISSLALSRPAEQALADPLLQALLRDAVVRDAGLHELLRGARQDALERRSLPLETLCAIAHQCFNTEYVLDETPRENERIAALRPAALYDWALYAAYRPLHTLEGAERLPAALASTPLASLAERQILEPLEERRLAGAIASLGETSDRVSSAVRAQYEQNPYPRWLRTQTQFDPAPLATVVSELFPAAGVPASSDPARILVAGCGTGQNAIAAARRFSDASVLAIDFSRASLAYAMRKTRELGIATIDYRQADILALDALDERFDLVEASGVLHHMAEPLAGWSILTGRVKPGGFMRIALYSERGRRAIVHARDFIARHGFEPTPAGIRRCRAAMLAAKDDALLASVTRNEDFYSLSGCRDLLFHVQEHRFQLPQIATMLDQLGLRFLGFEFPDSGITAARYRARFGDDAAMVNLENWARYEEDNPDAFARMYQFWVRKPG